MSASTNSTEQWTPVSTADRELVLKELDSILASYHFRGSKRYPALLQYVVDAALENRIGELKERTLGVEVFGRDPGYDTNGDPVVRVSAGEVRKRIAQYYHENGHASRVQIELPLGSYAPEFLLRASDAADPDAGPKRLATLEKAVRTRRSLMRDTLFVLAGVSLVGGGIAGYLYYQGTETGVAAAKKFWNPTLQFPRPVLVVVGTSHPDQMAPENDQTTFDEHMSNPYHHVSVSSAIALARLGGIMHQRGKDYEVKEVNETSLTDIRSRSLILVGAMNNEWSMRLLRPLRFHFTFVNSIASIQDSENPQQQSWSIDFTKPYSSITIDYAVVARFHDPTTEGPVLMIGGLGPYGTEAASEFLESPQHLAELTAKLPRGWENKNLEFVLKTNVIGAKAGPPVLVTTYTW
ncbi:MAG: hypothetical protein WAL45_17930 [Terracidiphilus sp.]